jgi:hypothetical protein
MLWGCFALLWIGWADHQKSYRSVAEGIRSGLPKGNRCIAEQGLGLAPRAALHYHADLLFVPFDASSPRACALVLTQASPHTELPLTGESWEKLVDVGRPGDKSERFRLYRWGP